MDQQPNPPQAPSDVRWEAHQRLLAHPYLDRLDAALRVIWRELNHGLTRRLSRIFYTWLAVDYLIIGLAAQLLSLWMDFPIGLTLQALLYTWALNGVYLALLMLLRLCSARNTFTLLRVQCKWLTLAVPALFPLELLFFLLVLVYPKCPNRFIFCQRNTMDGILLIAFGALVTVIVEKFCIIPFYFMINIVEWRYAHLF